MDGIVAASAPSNNASAHTAVQNSQKLKLRRAVAITPSRKIQKFPARVLHPHESPSNAPLRP